MGDKFFEGDAFVVLEPHFGAGDGSLFFLADLFVFEQQNSRKRTAAFI